MYEFENVDIMLEVKDKNRSFIKVNQYFRPSQKVIQQEWARYKYYIMSKSQKAYNQLRLMFKNNNNVDVEDFYKIIDDLDTHDININAEMNTFYHVWGYFKKIADNKEKKLFLNLIEQKDIDSIYRYLNRLANKYEVVYLQKSYYFKEN